MYRCVDLIIVIFLSPLMKGVGHLLLQKVAGANVMDEVCTAVWIHESFLHNSQLAPSFCLTVEDKGFLSFASIFELLSASKGRSSSTNRNPQVATSGTVGQLQP